jgi:uncharacterized protein (UPF0371 family)
VNDDFRKATMPAQNGFDSERYLEQQSAAILDRVKDSNGKLYLEFGVKTLAGIPDHIHLLPPLVTQSLSRFKTEVLKGKMTSLDLEETLIALSISGTLNPVAETVIGHLKELAGCEVHLSHIPSPGDAAGLRKLGVNATSEPEFASKYLFAG